MFGLITMLLTTLGATGMGSMLKIVAGTIQSINDGREAKAKREMARDLAMSNSDIKFQQAVFGNNSDPESNLFTRGTRRIIALIGMCNFATVSILCTLYPGVELVTPPENKEAIKVLWGLVTFPSGADVTTAITTGHISLVSVATLGAIIGFYFTPGGK
jgi:hypothetical protein